MARLTRATGEPAFAEHAAAALSHLAGRSRTEEFAAASFALAQRDLSGSLVP